MQNPKPKPPRQSEPLHLPPTANNRRTYVAVPPFTGSFPEEVDPVRYAALYLAITHYGLANLATKAIPANPETVMTMADKFVAYLKRNDEDQ